MFLLFVCRWAVVQYQLHNFTNFFPLDTPAPQKIALVTENWWISENTEKRLDV